MNLGEILARVRRNINFVYHDTDHMKNLINEALITISSEAKIQAAYPFTLVPGQSNYPLPTNYKEPISLIQGNGGNPDLTYGLTDIGAYDSGFYTYGGELWIRPTPQKEEGVTLYYYQYPDELTDEDDVPEIDSRYHDVLATYAAAMILSLPEVPGVSNTLIDRYFGVWDQRRAQFKADMQRKTKQSSVRKVTQYD